MIGTSGHALAPHLVVPRPVGLVIGHERPRSAAARALRAAFVVIEDLAALILMAWLIPFVILAIASPLILAIWAVLAIVRRL